MQRTNRFAGNEPWIATGVLLVAGIVLIVFSFRKPLSDYGNYYYGSRFLYEGKFGTNVYDPWVFNAMIAVEGDMSVYENYTPVPPFSAVFYLPFVFTSAAVSKMLFNLFGLLVFAFAFYRFLRRVPLQRAFLAVVCLLFALKINMDTGQAYVLLAGLLLAGWNCYLDKKYIAAALLWALAIHLKISPAIIFLFLLFEKNWKMLGWLLLATVALFLVALPFMGMEVWKQYTVDILPRLAMNEINNPFVSYTQSGTTFLRQLLVRDALLNPGALYDRPGLFQVLNAIWVFALLFIAALVTVSKKISPFMKFSFWLFAGMMASGYSTGYGLFLLLFPLLALWQLHKRATAPVFISLLLIALAAVPVIYYEQAGLLLRFSRLWVLVLLFAFLLYTLRPGFSLRPVMALLLLLPLGKILFVERPDKSDYVLKEEAALLIGDYEWKNDSLVLQTKTADGFLPMTVPMKGAAQHDSRISLSGNQLFLNGKQLTFSSDRKKNPMLAADSTIIYLSDKNRGVGFTTLRRIQP